MARCSFKPTNEQRTLVKSLSMIGLPDSHIAALIGRSIRTLERYFKKELNLGYAHAVGKVAQVAHEMAKSGKYPTMSRFWTETVGQSLDNIATSNNEYSFTLRTHSPAPPTDGKPHKRDAKGNYVTEHRTDGYEKSKRPRRTKSQIVENSNGEFNDAHEAVQKEESWQEPN